MKNELVERLIESLITEKDYVTVSSIANQLKVSAKTVRNYLSSEEINNILGGCIIEKKQNKGIKIVGDKNQLNNIKRKIYNIKNKSSIKETIINEEYEIYILKMLFTMNTPCTMNYLSKLVYRSTNSINREINLIEQWLESKNIKLLKKENFGIWIEGNEAEIREGFKEICIGYIYGENIARKKASLNNEDYIKIKALFNDIDIKELIKNINLIEIVLNNKFTTNDFNNLLIQLCVLITRIKIGKSIINKARSLSETKEFLAAQLLKVNFEENFKIELNSDEVNEITSYILSTRKQTSCFDDNGKIDSELDLANNFLDTLSNNLGIDLKADEDLIRSLLLHLKPAIRRIKLGAKADNPLLEQIRYQYTDIYIAVLTSIEIIEREKGVAFDESEIGYICLHIAAAIHRKENGSYIYAVLICNSGITISKYLESIIENKIKDIKISKVISSNELDSKIITKYDLVLDSYGIEFEEYPNIIKINELFNEYDYVKIKHWILQKQLLQLNKSVSRLAMLRGNIFLYEDEGQDYKKLLIKYGKNLEEKGYVKEGYAESLLEREEKACTAVGRMVAVPHGYNEFVIKCSLSVIKLKNSIRWGNQIVDLVFIFTPNSGENKYFFRKLYGVVMDNDKLKRIKDVENINEIEDLFIC